MEPVTSPSALFVLGQEAVRPRISPPRPPVPTDHPGHPAQRPAGRLDPQPVRTGSAPHSGARFPSRPIPPRARTAGARYWFSSSVRASPTPLLWPWYRGWAGVRTAQRSRHPVDRGSGVEAGEARKVHVRVPQGRQAGRVLVGCRARTTAPHAWNACGLPVRVACSCPRKGVDTAVTECPAYAGWEGSRHADRPPRAAGTTARV